MLPDVRYVSGVMLPFCFSVCASEWASKQARERGCEEGMGWGCLVTHSHIKQNKSVVDRFIVRPQAHKNIQAPGNKWITEIHTDTYAMNLFYNV